MSSDYGAEHAHKTLVQVVTEHRSRISDLPIPAGSWQEHHNRRNTKWNIFLLASFVALVGTAVVVSVSSVFDL